MIAIIFFKDSNYIDLYFVKLLQGYNIYKHVYQLCTRKSDKFSHNTSFHLYMTHYRILLKYFFSISSSFGIIKKLFSIFTESISLFANR